MSKLKEYLFLRFNLVFASAFLVLAVFSSALTAAKPVTIAHRGASGYLPEHSLEAVALAYGMGADFIEQDLTLSKDGIPVVLHDRQIDTMTDVKERFPDRKREDGRYYAIDFTLEELKQLNLTERKNYKTGKVTFSGRFPGGEGEFKISTLEEQLILIQGMNKSTGRNVGIYPELKAPKWHLDQGYDLSAIALPILHKYGYKTKEDLCWVQCFDLDEVKRFRHELGWEGNLLLLLSRPTKTETGFEYNTLRVPEELSEIAKTVDGLGPSLASILDSKGKPTGFMEMLHAENLVSHPYTVRKDSLPKPFDSIDDLHKALFVDAKIDGVFTDFSDLTADFIREMD